MKSILFKNLLMVLVIMGLLAACATPAAVPDTQLQLSQNTQVQTIDGNRWELVLETTSMTDLSTGRYTAKAVTAGKHGDWPAHLGVQRFLVAETSSTVSASMDIATRIMVKNTGEKQQVRFLWRFNPSRTADELMADYLTAASQGDLGFFLSTKNGEMLPAEVKLNNKSSYFGYGCWDCLSHTYGIDDPSPVSLNDPSVGHFGQTSKPTSSTLWPALVIPIPSPDENPDYVLDITITVPANADLVLWFGRYDVPTP